MIWIVWSIRVIYDYKRSWWSCCKHSTSPPMRCIHLMHIKCCKSLDSTDRLFHFSCFADANDLHSPNPLVANSSAVTEYLRAWLPNWHSSGITASWLLSLESGVTCHSPWLVASTQKATVDEVGNYSRLCHHHSISWRNQWPHRTTSTNKFGHLLQLLSVFADVLWSRCRKSMHNEGREWCHGSTVELVGCKVRGCAIDIATTMYHMVLFLISHYTEMPRPATHPLQPYRAAPSFHWGSLTC